MSGPKKCEQCGEQFENNNSYRMHRRVVHQELAKLKTSDNYFISFHRDPETGYFVCTCGFKAKVPDVMRRHVRSEALSHIGGLPDGSHVTPGGIMVPIWPLLVATVKDKGNPRANTNKVGEGSGPGPSGSAAPSKSIAPQACEKVRLSGFVGVQVQPENSEEADVRRRNVSHGEIIDQTLDAFINPDGSLGGGLSDTIGQVLNEIEGMEDISSFTIASSQGRGISEGSLSKLKQFGDHCESGNLPHPSTFRTSSVGIEKTPPALQSSPSLPVAQVSEPLSVYVVDSQEDADRSNVQYMRAGVSEDFQDQRVPSTIPAASGALVVHSDVEAMSEIELVRYADRLGIHFNSKYRVIICLECQSGVDRDHLFKHLKSHHGLPESERGACQKLVLALNPLPVLELVNPPQLQPAIENLKISDGFMCLRCPYTAKNSSTLLDHIRKGSCYKETEKTNKGLVKYQACKVQTFYPSLGKKPFAVRPEVDDRVSINLKGLTAEMIEQEHEYFEAFVELRGANKLLGEMPTEEISPWLKRTGYVLLFRDVKLIEIYDLMDGNRGTFAGYLDVLGTSLDEVFNKCVQIYKEKASVHSRRLMSSQIKSEYNRNPWDRVLLATEARYFGMFKKLVQYLVHLKMGRYLSQSPYKKLVVFTEDQNLKLDNVIRSLEQENKGKNREKAAFETLSFQLCVSLVKQEFAEGDTSKTALMHAVAVMSIGKDGAFRPASLVGPDLAALVYCGKMIFFRHATDLASLETEGTVDGTVCEQYRMLHHDYIAPANLAPVAEIINLLGLAKTLGQGESTVPDIAWSMRTDVEEITYRHVKINIDEFKEMIKLQIFKAKGILMEAFNINSSRWTTEEIAKISDDMSKRQRDYCFLTETRNMAMFPQKGKLDVVFKHRPLYSRLVRIVNGRLLYMAGGKAYVVSKAQELLNIILALFHMMGGQPARSTELMKITWKNSSTTHRNIFIFDGGLLFITDYFKGRNALGWSKFIPRFLSSEIAGIVIDYLDKVLPLYEFFTGPENLEMNVERTFYLFSNDGRSPWQGHVLAKVIKTISAAQFGEENSLTTASYRHVAISMSRRFLNEGFAEEVGDEDEDPLDLQAAHSTYTADRVYAVRSDILNGISERSLRVFMSLSISWHSFVYSRLTASQWMRKKMDRKEATRRFSCVCGDLTVGEEASVAAPIAASKARALTKDNGYYSNGYPVAVRLPVSPNIAKRARSVLSRIYGPDSRFKSIEQAEGLEKVLAGLTPLIVVLPTGGGKSLLFEGPAAETKAGVTVVVVPLIALREDLHRRALEHKVDSQAWAGRTSRDTSLIFVTAEAAVKPAFRCYIRYLVSKEMLDRVVIDEAHMIVFGVDFRAAYREIFWFSTLDVKVLFLTATLPPAMLGEFESGALIRNPTIVRASSNRINMKYEVFKKQRSYVTATVKKIIAEMRDQPDIKILIYTRTVHCCTTLGKELECGVYHSDSPGKDICLNTWLENGSRVLVTTTALGAGVDIYYIRLVFFVGMPHSFVDFAQGSGRGGRDCKPTRTIVLYSPDELGNASHQAFNADAEVLYTFLSTSRCRRYYMSHHFDDSERNCDPEQDELCDNCLRRGVGSVGDLSRFGIGPEREPINMPSDSPDLIPSGNVEQQDKDMTDEWSRPNPGDSGTPFHLEKRTKGRKVVPKAIIVDDTDSEEEASMPSKKVARQLFDKEQNKRNLMFEDLVSAPKATQASGTVPVESRLAKPPTHKAIVDAKKPAPRPLRSGTRVSHASLNRSPASSRITEKSKGESYGSSSLPKHRGSLRGGQGRILSPRKTIFDERRNQDKLRKARKDWERTYGHSPVRNQSALKDNKENEDPIWTRYEDKLKISDMWDRIQLALQSIHGVCGFCWVTTRTSIALDHDIKACNQRIELIECPPYQPTYSQYCEWRRNINWEAYSCCFSCALPAKLCSSAKSGDGCAYGRDRIAPVTFMALFIADLREEVEKLMGVPFDLDGYNWWLTRKIDFYEQEGANIMRVFEIVIDFPDRIFNLHENSTSDWS